MLLRSWINSLWQTCPPTEPPGSVHTHYGYLLFPQLTIQTFETLLLKLERRPPNNENVPKELYQVNETLLRRLYQQYLKLNQERLRAPVIYRYHEEMMKDIEKQLFINLIGTITIEVVCLKNITNEQFVLNVSHGKVLSSVEIAVRDEVWQKHYTVQGVRQDFIQLKVNPMEPIELELFYRQPLLFGWGLPIRCGTNITLCPLDIIGMTSFHDFLFGDVSARIKLMWTPYHW